jgi:hypothetical protein
MKPVSDQNIPAGYCNCIRRSHPGLRQAPWQINGKNAGGQENRVTTHGATHIDKIP